MNKLFFMSLLFMLHYCNEVNKATNTCISENSCSQDIKSVKVQIVDANGNGVPLDEHITFIESSGKIFNFDYNEVNGSYTLLTDEQIHEIKEDGSKVIFKGALNGREIRKEFIIARNCCHITNISESNSIVLAQPDQLRD